MRHILLFLFVFFVNLPLYAVQFQGAFTQGGFAFAQVPIGTKVTYNDKEIPVTSTGWFGVGFDRNHAPEAKISLLYPSGKTEVETLLIIPQTYKTQHIQGVKQSTVTPNKTQNTRAAQESAAIKKSRSQASDLQSFFVDFKQPVQGEITGIFGSRRTYNGIEKNWHKGLDFAAPTGTSVLAPTKGKVVFAADTFYNGNLIILDHGNQFFTIYAHLNSMDVKVGDMVISQQKIGEVGTTGRSTGPHLHFGFYWKNVALDPKLLLGINN